MGSEAQPILAFASYPSMRMLGAVCVCVGAGLLAGAAVAGPIPIPPLPTTTVSVPPVPVPVPVPVPPAPAPGPAPVPLPPVPKLPPPVLQAPVPTTTAAASAPSASQAAGRLAGSASSVPTGISSGSASPASSTSSSSSPSSSASSSSDGGARVDHFHSSRPWIGTGGPKRRRTTTFTFVLQRAGRVVFTVNQVSPACVGVGHFSVAGHAGVNRVRFAGVIKGRRLSPGTYRISIRSASGRIVRRVTLVVVGGAAPSRDELNMLRAANVCQGGTAQATTSPGSSATAAVATTAGGGPSAPLGTQPLPQPKTSAEGLGPSRGPNLHSGVLGSSVEETARALQPALIAMLALAILLLGAASLPREAVPGPRVHDVLARHRVELAGLGAAALVAVAVVFILS
jgi:hypothetical protein